MKGKSKRTSTPQGAAHEAVLRAVSAKHTQGTLTPQLRFPEFEEPWNAVPLAQVAIGTGSPPNSVTPWSKPMSFIAI